MDKEQLFTISDVIKNIGDTVVMPRFKNLKAEEIKEKDIEGSSKKDIVTSTDYESQSALIRELRKFNKDAVFIAEENVCAIDDLKNAMRDKKDIFIIDPLDGTSNFAKGNENFAIAVSYLKSGENVASWIYLPAKKQMLSGNKDGVYLDGKEIKIDPTKTTKTIDVNGEHKEVAGKSFALDRTSSCSCSYFNAVTGKIDGIVFDKKLLPWDHSAGTFLHKQAGGYNAYLDNAKYDETNNDRVTIIMARNYDEFKKLNNHAKNWQNEAKQKRFKGMLKEYFANNLHIHKEAKEEEPKKPKNMFKNLKKFLDTNKKR